MTAHKKTTHICESAFLEPVKIYFILANCFCILFSK